MQVFRGNQIPGEKMVSPQMTPKKILTICHSIYYPYQYYHLYVGLLDGLSQLTRAQPQVATICLNKAGEPFSSQRP